MKRFLLILCAATTALAYDPPVGIPDPVTEFGYEIDVATPDDPAEWPGAESAGYYYVDPADGDATDTANTWGYPDKPRVTPPTTLTAGQVVKLGAGPFTGSTFTITAVAGTSESPCWISGVPTTRTDWQRQIRIRGDTSHLIIENLDMSGLDRLIDIRPGANGEDVNHVIIRNCVLTGTGEDSSNGTMIGATSAYDTPVSYLVRYNNTLSSGGDWELDEENDLHALGIASNLHHVWDLHNTVFHMGGDAVGNGHNANHTAYALYIGGNTFYENRENAIDLKEVHDVVISSNTCWGYEATSSSEGAAIVIHYGPTTGEGPYNVWIVNNLIYESVYGIVSSGLFDGAFVGESWWIGNVVRDCGTGLNPDRGGGIFTLASNTVVDCTNGIVVGGVIDELTLANNIVVNCSTSYLSVTDSTVRAASTVSNELYWESGGGAVSIGWGTTYTSVAAWIAGTDVGDNSVEADPLFANYAGNNFALGEGSPAIGAGVSLASVRAAFVAAFGESIATDIAGTARPQNTTEDIGAYEYDEDADPPAGEMTAPATATASVISPHSLRLTWDNVTDETGFRLYRDGVFVAAVAADVTSYDFTNLRESTEYALSVSAYDAYEETTATADSETTSAVAARSGGRGAVIRR